MENNLFSCLGFEGAVISVPSECQSDAVAPGAGLGIQDIAYQQFLQAVNSAAASAFDCFLGPWLFTASVQRWKPSIIYLVDLPEQFEVYLCRGSVGIACYGVN